MGKQRATEKQSGPEPKWAQMPQIKSDAAGLDISEAEIVACVPCERADEPIRSFGTFTPDLCTLVDWLQACGIKTVAMESTGVYWIPLYELLEERGIEAYVVNERHQLTQVLADITGVTGLQVTPAIAAGERQLIVLAQLHDRRCGHSTEHIAKALTGAYREERVFALKQALAPYELYTAQIPDCDAQMEQHYNQGGTRPWLPPLVHFPRSCGRTPS